MATAGIDRAIVNDIAAVRALVFDVFGTVVDWRGSILAELEALGRAQGITADWPRFVDGWRAGYQPAMQRVREGAAPWQNIDALHRQILDGLLADHGITTLDEAEKQHLNFAWHRLDPWPDSVAGLTRLKRRHIIGTLSNGNVRLLVDMAKRAGLPWDVIFSAELVRRYKPDCEAYLMVPGFLGLAPGEVMLVAAHRSDLLAAARCGLRTGYVRRLMEYGSPRPPTPHDDSGFDIVARDFEHLAELMSA